MTIGNLLAQITGEQSTSSTQSTHGELNSLKRKSEDQTRRVVSTTQAISLSATNTSRDKGSLGNNKKLRISSTSQNNTVLHNGQPKPLKKGSYAEIMARGKAAHAILGQVGKIIHKDIQRSSKKREREVVRAKRFEKRQKIQSLDEKAQKLEQSRGRKAEKVPLELPKKKIKKAALATTGYTGTARPKSSNETNLSRVSNPSFSNTMRDMKRISSKSVYKNLGEDEEDRDDYDDEEEFDYESDLSDMEAAIYEVDEEEEIAARIARREDAEALAEENRLKREKEEKRKKLTAMAKSRSVSKY